jgi:hypothetical protein
MCQLRNGHFNRVFEVVGIKYLPRPEPAARGSKKRKVVASSEAEAVPSKAMGAKRWRRASLRAGDKTSEKKFLLVKPLNPSKKFEGKETRPVPWV